MPKFRPSRIKDAAILAAPLLAAAAALFLGAYGLSPHQVLAAVKDGLAGVDTPAAAVVLDIRLPRIMLAGLTGLALSASGAALQAVLRNPLVDPFILGISSGAAFGCALSIGLAPFFPLQLAAFLGGGGAVAGACVIARGADGLFSRLSLVLAGVIVSAFFAALVSLIKFFVDPMKLQSIVYWLMGSFSLADWARLRSAGVGVVLGCLPIFLLRWRLNVISMGDDEARVLGVHITRKRLVLVAAATLAASSAVAVCGIVGWVGLMTPHLVRMLAGPDHKRLIPLSMAAGAAVMILADTAARNLTDYDIPVGIVTALAGAPFFVYLLKRNPHAFPEAP